MADIQGSLLFHRREVMNCSQEGILFDSLAAIVLRLRNISNHERHGRFGLWFRRGQHRTGTRNKSRMPSSHPTRIQQAYVHYCILLVVRKRPVGCVRTYTAGTPK